MIYPVLDLTPGWGASNANWFVNWSQFFRSAATVAATPLQFFCAADASTFPLLLLLLCECVAQLLNFSALHLALAAPWQAGWVTPQSPQLLKALVCRRSASSDWGNPAQRRTLSSPSEEIETGEKLDFTDLAEFDLVWEPSLGETWTGFILLGESSWACVCCSANGVFTGSLDVGLGGI